MNEVKKFRDGILLRHLLERIKCEIAVRMRTSVRYVIRTSRLGLLQLVKNHRFFLSFYDFSSSVEAVTKRNCFAEALKKSIVKGKAILLL